MDFHRPAVGFLVCGAVSTVVMACGPSSQPSRSDAQESASPSPNVAGSPSPRADVHQQVGVDATRTPLWSVHHADRTAGALSVHAAEIDGAGNAFVLAHSVRDQNFVYQFDADGAFVASVPVKSGQYLSESYLRANATGFVTQGTQTDSLHGTTAVFVDRFDASRARSFEYVTQSAKGAGADLCPDGRAIVAVWQAGGATVTSLGPTGTVQWTTTYPGMIPTRVRCLSDGRVVVVGTSSGAAAAVQIQSDGTQGFAWTGTDPVSSRVSFDAANGTIYVGATAASGQYEVYAVGARGNLQWSWLSTRTGGTLAAVAASSVVVVTGGAGTAALDASGNLLWAADTTGAGAALDGAGGAFACGSAGLSASNAISYAADGTTQWSYAAPLFDPVRADVTNAVARCIGTQQAGIGIVAFQVQ